MSKKTIAALIRVTDEFRKLDAEMPMQTAAVFLHVMFTPGVTMKDLADRCGISQASTSRNIAALSKWHRLGKAGHDLVEAVEDPAERRRKIVNLTPKGKRVRDAILSTVGDFGGDGSTKAA